MGTGSTTSVAKRGFWVNDANDLQKYLQHIAAFTIEGREELIRCPTLLTMAEADPLAAGVPSFLDALQCPKTLIRFGVAGGAGDHCKMMNRSLLNRRSLDWLDKALALPTR